MASLSRLALASLLALALAPAALARADEPEPEVSDEAEAPAHDAWDRMLGVELVGGLDPYYGVIGGAVRLSPHENLMLDVGGGSSRDGVRVGGGVSLVLPQDMFALVMRVGIAGGPETWTGGYNPVFTRTWDFSVFLDADIALEYRHPEGFTGRLMFGLDDNLLPNADRCTAATTGTTTSGPSSCDVSDGGHPARVYLGLAVGYMFDIFR